MVFASPSGQFYRDMTNPAHLSGHTYLDNFIVTRKSCPLTGTVQKHMPTPTQTATPYTTGPLAGIKNNITRQLTTSQKCFSQGKFQVIRWTLAMRKNAR